MRKWMRGFLDLRRAEPPQELPLYGQIAAAVAQRLREHPEQWMKCMWGRRDESDPGCIEGHIFYEATVVRRIPCSRSNDISLAINRASGLWEKGWNLMYFNDIKAKGVNDMIAIMDKVVATARAKTP